MSTLSQFVFGTFKKLFGPFAWILPTEWTVGHLLSADYALYPGMFLWYGVFPFILLGIATTAHDTLRNNPTSWVLQMLLIVLSLYAVQYFVLNLSYRQRDDMFPFAILFGIVGWSATARFSSWWRAYNVYLILLWVIAIVHLCVRAIMYGALRS